MRFYLTKWVVLIVLLPAIAETQTAAPMDARDAADRAVNVLEPDFVTVNLPTTLRLPRMKSSFRISHRFARSWTNGSLGDLAADLFGLDNGALIGLEYRFGLERGLQAGIYRTSSKTIQFFGQYDVLRQAGPRQLKLHAVASIEGLNNFHRGDVVGAENNEYATAVGAIVSRTFGARAIFYLQPSAIIGANAYTALGCVEHTEHGHDLPECHDADAAGVESNTLLLGVSSRIRLSDRLYLVGSGTPRVMGFGPNASLKTFGIEKRLGGHMFQLNISNSLGTTMAEMARGASNNDDWFVGFNISRKFF